VYTRIYVAEAVRASKVKRERGCVTRLSDTDSDDGDLLNACSTQTEPERRVVRRARKGGREGGD
jgi:hypothetical protein